MSLGYPDPRLANSTTGIYLQRTFNIEPKETRFMPGIGKAKNSSERLRMGIDCDEVYPGIIIGKKNIFQRSLALRSCVQVLDCKRRRQMTVSKKLL